MKEGLDSVALHPGDSVRFEDRDDLLSKLDDLDRQVPASRTTGHREHYSMLRYLRFLAGEGLLPLPVTLTKVEHDPPDFTLDWGDRRETFELTDGSSREYQRQLSKARRSGQARLDLPVDINTPDKEARELWVEIVFSAFLRKARMLVEGRFEIDHLLVYDLTGLGLFVPLVEGRPRLGRRIDAWHREAGPSHRFKRVSVLRDNALLLDVAGEAKILCSESPYYRLPMIAASDEQDLRRRLRELDRYCRDNSIRHLKLFGSILHDRSDGKEGEGEQEERGYFREDSDVDLLVEFEPDAVVTLFDMARMERELSELIGIKVDLRTAGDLSRYFRQEVLEEAVELHARRA